MADADRRTFWKSRRFRYNVALLASGVLAGVAFFAVLVAWEIWPAPPGQFARADFEMLSARNGESPGRLSVSRAATLVCRPLPTAARSRRAA